ncbi:hypothetical protein BDN72DRAFT_579998 [Pluteus cervinus]|uniref:Uncharacterized protein n=1 Tax=Pluteus cervinus TaxID=181527 RepID=A0ACD3AW43_9AGAR|nr:hypothetical protein BDN72DRAFT_579998 [Pluteus cervinus]
MADSILVELPYWGLEGTLNSADVVIPTRSARVQKNGLYTTTLIELRRSVSRHGTRRAQLIYFVEMVPPEITDHILGFLHPLDLYHFTRTTKYLRRLLLTPKAEHCWQDSYLNHSDFPSYPKGCSPPRWINLLFEDSTPCGFCITRVTKFVEAIQLHRICSNCATVRYTVHDSRYVALFRKIASAIHPSLAIEAEMMIASTLLTPSFRFSIDGTLDPVTTQVYWKAEAEEMIRTYSTLRYQVQLEEGDAQPALDAYIAKRIVSIDEVHKRREAYKAWAEHVNSLIQTGRARRQQIHFAKIKARFIEEGFIGDDLQTSRLRDYFSVPALSAFSCLSRARWNKLYAIARPILDDVKRLRLIHERHNLILRRYNALTKMYNTYVFRLRRSEIPLMPVQLPILRFQQLQDLLFDESKVEVDDRVCEELMNEFVDELKKWRGERTREIAGRVVSEYPDVIEMCGLNQRSQRPTGPLRKAVRRCGDLIRYAMKVYWPRSSNRPASSGPRNFTPAESQTILHLPFAVFNCTRCNPSDATSHPILGYDEISPHLGCQTAVSTQDMWRFEKKYLVVAQPNLNFSKEHSEFVFKFVKDTTGRDPYGTTTRELDESGDRFVCETCGVVAGGMRAYSWRECLRHFQGTTSGKQSGAPEHSVSSFIRLSPEAADEVIRREIPQRVEKIWTCILCPAGVNTLQDYGGVKSHIQAEHAITRPYRGVHFINRLCRVSRRKPAKLLNTGAARTDRKCTRCPLGRATLWSERGLKSHLRYKHQIENITEQDYRVVKLLVTDPD